MAFRRFGEEMLSVIRKRVAITTSDGKKYEGDLVGINEKLDIIIDNASGVNEDVSKIVLNGSFIKEIRLVGKPFDLRALAGRLGKIFPGMIRLREDIGAIIVMEKIKVTEQGVVEGSGLAVEKVKAVYEQFMRETAKPKSES